MREKKNGNFYFFLVFTHRTIIKESRLGNSINACQLVLRKKKIIQKYKNNDFLFFFFCFLGGFETSANNKVKKSPVRCFFFFFCCVCDEAFVRSGECLKRDLKEDVLHCLKKQKTQPRRTIL